MTRTARWAWRDGKLGQVWCDPSDPPLPQPPPIGEYHVTCNPSPGDGWLVTPVDGPRRPRTTTRPMGEVALADLLRSSRRDG